MINNYTLIHKDVPELYARPLFITIEVGVNDLAPLKDSRCLEWRLVGAANENTALFWVEFRGIWETIYGRQLIAFACMLCS